jgi:hypothetical protein
MREMGGAAGFFVVLVSFCGLMTVITVITGDY